MIGATGLRGALPEPVRRSLDAFRESFGLDFRIWARSEDDAVELLHPLPDPDARLPTDRAQAILPRSAPSLLVEAVDVDTELSRSATRALAHTVEQLYDSEFEREYFSDQASRTFEELNLLRSVGETLGSILHLEEAARIILTEICDVLEGRRGSLWLHDSARDELRLLASVGAGGLAGPLAVANPRSVTARAFREERPILLSRGREVGSTAEQPPPLDPLIATADSVISVPVRHFTRSGASRTIGVINLIGRARGGRFSGKDQVLLSAIASQVGAALENNRLIRESLARERMGREMELAHDLQMKLLPPSVSMQGVRVAARVQPADQVGGDFYHVLKLPEGRVGVMIGDVSGHGFPAALIMALSMSAVSIYASEIESPGEVLRQVERALRDELETTEMYLSLFYAVVDPLRGELRYVNAGHPHAFVIRPDGRVDRLRATEPPVGLAVSDDLTEGRVPFDPTVDLLLLFTDGLSDHLSGGHRKGEDVVVQEVVRLRHGAPDDIVETLFGLLVLAIPGVPSDDRTVLVLRG